MKDNDWQRIETLFHLAQELPEHQRLIFLQQQCGDDQALIDAVYSLLVHDGHADTLITPVLQAAQAFLNPEQDLSGQMLGPYLLVKPLAEGGMGAVYLAERADQQYQQQVAIKLIRTGQQASQAMQQRFKTERQILAQLQHPNIARLLDGGTTEHGLPYLVMEYVQGLDIKQHCQQRATSLSDKLKLFIKVCQAVQYAHQKLIVHRDFKPSNILVQADGEPKLLDFGIAKLLDNTLNAQWGIDTRTQERAMTPLYASPEQIQGHTVTVATDVYALGALFYELLTDRPLFEAQSTPYALEKSILETTPLPPSQAVLEVSENDREPDKLLSRQLAGDLDNILLKALNKEPELRYASVWELGKDLDNVLNHKPVKARASSLLYRTGKFLRRNMLASALSMTLLVMVSVASAAIWLQSVQVKAERDIAQQQRDKAETERGKSEAVSRFLTSMFSKLRPTEAQGREISLREVLDSASAKLDDESSALAKQPLIEAAVRREVGDIYYRIGVLLPAIAHLEKALAIHRAHNNSDHTGLLYVLLSLSNSYSRADRHTERLPLLEEAVELSKIVRGPDSEFTLGQMTNLGGFYNDTGRSQDAVEIHLQVLQTARRALGEDNIVTLLAITSLGADHLTLWNYAQAADYFQQGLARCREVLGEQHSLTVYNLGRLGHLQEMQGNYDKAIDYANQYLQSTLNIYGEAHQDSYEAKYRLARVQLQKGEFIAAEALLQEVITGLPPLVSEVNGVLYQAQGSLADLYLQTNRIEQAKQLATSVLAAETEMWRYAHAKTLETALLVANIQQKLGETQDAMAGLQKTLAAWRSIREDHPAQYEPLVALAKLSLQAELNAQSQHYLQQAAHIAEQTLEINRPSLTWVHEQLDKLQAQATMQSAI